MVLNVNLSKFLQLIFFFVYESKYYLQVYLDNPTCKIVNTEMIDYLDENLFVLNRN